MSGRTSISAYTPSNTDPELLKRIFVQREKLLERIVDRLARSMSTGDKHHILLVGPRGSGKTHLVSLAAWELHRREELRDVMRIAWLGEDDSFTGFIHLAFGIAKQLGKDYPKEFPSDFKTPVRGLPPDDAALAVLNSIVERLQHRNLILITENMDQTFRGLRDSGRKKWRAFLQETKRIATLATSQQLFAGVSDRKEAFFGFFDIQHLEPLSVEEARELICRISVVQNKPELVAYLNSAEGRFRIRALHYLAGGNHRMYVLLAEFLTKDSLDDLVTAFENLAHDMTPYFQERLGSLPDQQRQLVQCLCDAEGALTVKEVAEETFIDERSCSKQLGNLKSKGYVRSEKRGKESYYDMAEPLMRLCLEVKNQRGRPLKMVVRFLRAWFPATALQTAEGDGAVSARVNAYRLEALQSGNLFQSAIAGRLKTEIRETIESGRYEIAKDLADELRFADEISAFWVDAELASHKGDIGLEVKNLTKIIETADAPANQKAWALNIRGVTYGQQGQLELALSDYSAVIEMPDAPADQKAWALNIRGVTYGQQGQLELALSDYSAVIEMPDAPADQKARALYKRGYAYRQQGQLELALSDYSAVIEMPDAPADQKVMALNNRGYAYGQQGLLELALSDYSAAIEMPDAPADLKARPLNNRGYAYGQQGLLELELSDYSAVIEMPDAPADQKARALINRGITFGKQGRVELELSDFSAVIEMPAAPADQRAWALNHRGVTYRQQGQLELALSDYSAAIEMPDAPADQKARALNHRGDTYRQQGQLEQALSDFSAVIEMPDARADQKARALNNRGVTYGQQGQLELELSDYSAVIEMPDAPAEQKAWALDNRGVAKWHNKEFSASQIDFEAVLEINDVSADQRTNALFAVPEPMVDHCSRAEVVKALLRAFEEGDSQSDEYGGTPEDLLWMVLRRGPVEWADYIAEITPLFIRYHVAEKLGQGVTKSIEHLDRGGYSESQLDAWNSAWQAAGKDCEDLQIPLRCLDAAVEVMKSDPRTDRPLFRLPLEIRRLVRPLLNESLGPTD